MTSLTQSSEAEAQTQTKAESQPQRGAMARGWTGTLTIAKRELSALFFSPVAYLVLGVFAFIATGFFIRTFGSSAPAELRQQFSWLVWLLVFIAPAISMRLLSEELRSGTIELLMSAPLNDTQVVIGKWLGAMVFYLALMLPLVVHAIVLETVANPDYGPIISGLLGLVLVGGLYIAIGLAVSAATDSQLIAYLITVLIAGLLTIGVYLIVDAAWVQPWMREALYYINVNQQYGDFAKGLIDTSHFVFFLSGIALFLFLAVMVLQSRRWR